MYAIFTYMWHIPVPWILWDINSQKVIFLYMSQKNTHPSFFPKTFPDKFTKLPMTSIPPTFCGGSPLWNVESKDVLISISTGKLRPFLAPELNRCEFPPPPLDHPLPTHGYRHLVGKMDIQDPICSSLSTAQKKSETSKVTLIFFWCAQKKPKLEGG